MVVFVFRRSAKQHPAVAVGRNIHECVLEFVCLGSLTVKSTDSSEQTDQRINLAMPKTRWS